MDETEKRLEIQRQNQVVLRRAFNELQDKVVKALHSRESMARTNAIVSEPLHLTDRFGNMDEYRLKLDRMKLTTVAPDILLDLLNSNGESIVAAEFIVNGPHQIEGTKEQGVQYDSSLHIHQESLGGVGIGSVIFEERESLLLRIWKELSDSSNFDYLRLVTDDHSEPQGWTSKQALTHGYNRIEDANENLHDLPHFEKYVPLKERRRGSLFGGIFRRKKD
ncbi:hypothetical protein KBD71_01155 [Candidatus Woesebacteria bacterium]|nr:hypothetical protein [Candidatus Woesebacteria bacterium]